MIVLLSAAVAVYAMFNDVFTANDTLNSIALFVMCLCAFTAVMVRFRKVLL